MSRRLGARRFWRPDPKIASLLSHGARAGIRLPMAYRPIITGEPMQDRVARHSATETIPRTARFTRIIDPKTG